jgi:hypothetical protein
MTPSRIEPATFRLVAQCLNQLHCRVPHWSVRKCELHWLLQGKQCTYKRNIETRSRDHCCSATAVSITYCECVFAALVIQHALRIPSIIFSFVACLALQYFPTLSHKRHDFRNKKSCWTQNVCSDFRYSFLTLGRTERNVKCPLLLSGVNETWIFSTDFRETLKYKMSWKWAQWESNCSIRTDRQTDMTVANSRISQVC